MNSLCACGHPLDHLGEVCLHADCGCLNGTPIEVVQLQVSQEMNGTMMRILAVMEAASDIESRLIPNGDGTVRVQVRKRPPVSPALFVPN